MAFLEDESGVSDQALKLAAAVLIGSALFLLLVSIARETAGAEQAAGGVGKTLLKANQNVSNEILKHAAK